MNDIIEYYKWLYADFPNLWDISVLLLLGVAIAVIITFKIGDKYFHDVKPL